MAQRVHERHLRHDGRVLRGEPEDLADYLIGEEFDLQTHLGFRRMDQPSSDGASVDRWTRGRPARRPLLSGVGNHLYYLLAEGSGSKTIGGVAHRLDDLQRLDAHRDRLRRRGEDLVPGLTVYMTSSTNYAGARTATLNAGGPARRRQRPVQRRRGRLERSLRRLTASRDAGAGRAHQPGARAGVRSGRSVPVSVGCGKNGAMTDAVPLNFSIVTLGVTDLERSVRFYTDLGWEQRGNITDGIVWFKTSGTWLGLFGYDALADDAHLEAPPQDGSRATGDHAGGQPAGRGGRRPGVRPGPGGGRQDRRAATGPSGVATRLLQRPRRDPLGSPTCPASPSTSTVASRSPDHDQVRPAASVPHGVCPIS